MSSHVPLFVQERAGAEMRIETLAAQLQEAQRGLADATARLKSRGSRFDALHEKLRLGREAQAPRGGGGGGCTTYVVGGGCG